MVDSFSAGVCSKCVDVRDGKPVITTIYRVVIQNGSADRLVLHYASKRDAARHNESVVPVKVLLYNDKYYILNEGIMKESVRKEYQSGAKERALAKLSAEDKRALGLT